MEFFLCFSLLRNTRDVLKTDVAPGAVTSLYGLRVVSLFWVILGHVYVYSNQDGIVGMLKPLFHSSPRPTRKLVARTFIQSQYLKALTASLRVGFCDEWKRGLSLVYSLTQN